MKINEITVEDIKAGKNWRVVDPSEFAEVELEDLTIAEQVAFSPEDYVVYSTIYVTDSGRVTPMVTIREVGTLEYGGDMCELKDGKWQRLGATPNPNLQEFGKEYIANPLPNDPTFDTGDPMDDEPAYNRTQFKQWAERL